MSDDIVERLRTFDIYDYADADKICREAAARIESQAARIAELEAALRDITARLLETFPGLKNLPPIQKATAALERGEDE